MSHSEMLDTLLSLTISLLMGILIGIERERSHPERAQFIGVRTFTLLAMLGTVLSILKIMPLTITVSAFIFTILALNYYHQVFKQKTLTGSGVVTELSGVMIFCLGYMVTISPLLAIILSATILLVLIERKRLHVIARKKFKPHEMETAIILIIFTLGIIPILPNHAIDSWHLLNPRQFGLLMATIAGIQLIGYIVTRLFGERLGIALNGFSGGLISSTAVFALLPNILRFHPQSTYAIFASGLLANVAMLLDVIAIIFVASPMLLTDVIFPIGAMIGASVILSWILLRYQPSKGDTLLSLSSFLNLISMMRTVLFLGFVLIMVAIAKQYVSTQGMAWLSFVGGLVEIHGVTLATALLYLGHHLSMGDARLFLFSAILASYISKYVLLWALMPCRFAAQMSLLLSGVLFSGAIVYFCG